MRDTTDEISSKQCFVAFDTIKRERGEKRERREKGKEGKREKGKGERAELWVRLIINTKGADAGIRDASCIVNFQRKLKKLEETP